MARWHRRAACRSTWLPDSKLRRAAFHALRRAGDTNGTIHPTAIGSTNLSRQGLLPRLQRLSLHLFFRALQSILLAGRSGVPSQAPIRGCHREGAPTKVLTPKCRQVRSRRPRAGPEKGCPVYRPTHRQARRVKQLTSRFSAPASWRAGAQSTGCAIGRCGTRSRPAQQRFLSGSCPARNTCS